MFETKVYLGYFADFIAPRVKTVQTEKVLFCYVLVLAEYLV